MYICVVKRYKKLGVKSVSLYRVSRYIGIDVT